MSGGGYPLEWFSQTLDNSILCGICNRVFREPRATPCGHIFCHHCISPWLERYGVCPKRCMEVEIDSLRLKVQLEKFISGLFTHCKNKRAGCTEQVRLADKHLHEKQCPFRKRSGKPVTRSISNSSSGAQRDSSVVSVPVTSKRNRHKRTQSSVSAYSSGSPVCVGIAAQRSPSVFNLSKVASKSGSALESAASTAAACKMNSKEVFTTHTFRLKRTKAKEPLGLVLLSGEKTSEGRPKSFYVKQVHPDTLGWKAGVQAKDRIIQVDFHDLASINPQEAVARIKEKSLVTITVLRGSNTHSHSQGTDLNGYDSHVYDEILYTDFSQGQSQGHASSQGFSQDEGLPNNGVMSTNHFALKTKPGRSSSSEDKNQRLRMQQQQLSSSSLQLQYGKDRTVISKQGKAPRERGSKDSGLSSGSSGHQDDIEPPQGRHTFVGAPHGGMDGSRHHQIRRTGSNGSGSFQPEQHVSNAHCRIEGDYEVENIYLQKNGTSQLGITLGYNTEVQAGGLHVCEVVPNGLAAQNGRLRSGDIIRRVNGFEVHDPEEAILLFLEQDQDITLTVARPLKVPGRVRHTPPRITNTPPRSFGSTPHTPTTGHFPSNDLGGHNYAVLETTRAALVNDSNSFRRVDSCGTLDSRKGTTSRQSQTRSPLFVPDNEPDPTDRPRSRTGYDKMRRTKSTGSTSSWNTRRKDAHVKSVSPPAVTRQPSPLVNHQQQQQLPPTQDGAIYQVLEPTSPIYHVLHSPPPPHSQPTNTTTTTQQRNPPPPFLNETCEPFYDNPIKSPFGKATAFASSQHIPAVNRPASTGPHGRHRIGSSSGRDKIDTRNNHMQGHSSSTFRSIANEVNSMRSETVPVDYQKESLV